MKAYRDFVEDAIKIESKWTSATAYVAKRETVDIIAFRGTQEKLDILTDLAVIPVPYAGRLCHGGLLLNTPLFGKRYLNTLI